MIKIDQNYTDYRDDGDPKYPGGKAVDAATAEGADGTPLLASWMNDINGTRQAIFIEAFGNIDKVSGKPDNVQESDVLKAVKKITQDYTDKTNNAESQARAQGDANTLSSAKKYTDDLLIKIFQNGYIQWPGMPSPLKESSLHFEGYSWYEVNYGGNFFRAKGWNARAFSNKRLTKGQIKGGAYIFQDDEQGDAIRNIVGTLGLFYSEIFGHCDGAFETVHKWAGQYSNRSVTGSSSDIGTIVFNAEKASGVTTAEENRARNLTFTIWVLVKD